MTDLSHVHFPSFLELVHWQDSPDPTYLLLSDDCVQVALRCNGSDELRPCFSSGTDFLHPSPPTPTRRHLVMSLRHLWLSHIREGVTDNQWIKVRDAVKYTTMHKNKTVVYSPKQRNIWSLFLRGKRETKHHLKWHKRESGTFHKKARKS